jgi:probable phosphoglycerate mutase
MIYITRHGQTDWNTADKIQGQTDIPLNNCGREQALLLSPQIQSLNIKQIITSDLNRAQETAQLLNNHIRVPLMPDERLREINFGDLEGQPVSGLTPEIWDALSRPSNAFHAESLPEAYQRIRSFFSGLNSQENTLIVTHGGLLKVISYYIKYPHRFDYPLFRSDFLYISLPNATIFRQVKRHNQALLEQLSFYPSRAYHKD